MTTRNEPHIRFVFLHPLPTYPISNRQNLLYHPVIGVKAVLFKWLIGSQYFFFHWLNLNSIKFINWTISLHYFQKWSCKILNNYPFRSSLNFFYSSVFASGSFSSIISIASSSNNNAWILNFYALYFSPTNGLMCLFINHLNFSLFIHYHVIYKCIKILSLTR